VVARLVSDREIARRCAVDNSFVSRLRGDLSVDKQQIADPDAAPTTKKPTTRKARRNGD
jgi:hypothetical protein